MARMAHPVSLARSRISWNLLLMDCAFRESILSSVDSFLGSTYWEGDVEVRLISSFSPPPPINPLVPVPVPLSLATAHSPCWDYDE